MKILCIDNKVTYNLWKKGIAPAHWIYGVSIMEKEEHIVINEEYHGAKLSKLLIDIYYYLKHRPDIIYFPFIHPADHALLFLFRALRILKCPIVGIVHRTPRNNKIFRFIIKGIDHAFFLSPKNRKEVIELGMIPENKTSDAQWGPDLDFYAPYRNIETSDYYISTGKENRDYDIIVSAFKKTNAKLRVLTCHKHAGSSYDYLLNYQSKNIQIELSENSGTNFSSYLQEMAHAQVLVCPLKTEKLNYCVGLSTIADAIALAKPLIITNNPYHYLSATEEGIGFGVSTEKEWLEAINKIESNPSLTKVMGKKSFEIAKERFNIEKCGQHILFIMKRLIDK